MSTCIRSYNETEVRTHQELEGETRYVMIYSDRVLDAKHPVQATVIRKIKQTSRSISVK